MTSPRLSAPSAEPLLEARGLTRRFGAARALRGVSLAVHPGECHLVVGPNGAGKTTLLRLLAGLARPSDGSVLLNGRSLRDDPSLRGGIGLLSHQTQLYHDLTPRENLRFAGRLHALPDGEARATAQLEALGLLDRADEPVHRLSRGMVQRVAIGRALLHRPRLLLLDEPFTGLDPVSAERVRGRLRAERDGGTALVLVSHDVHEAWELATHAHILLRGAWVAGGPREATLAGFLALYREVLGG